jgi:hypothetical protein
VGKCPVRNGIYAATPPAARTLSHEKRTVSPTFSVALGLGLILLWITTSVIRTTNFDYPAFLLAGTIYAAVGVACPALRLDIQTLSSPRQWAALAFALQLVVVPCFVLIFGPSRGQLTVLPPQSAMNLAVIFLCVTYVVFAAVLGVKPCHGTVVQSQRRRRTSKKPFIPSRQTALVFLAAGTVGMILHFHTVGSISAYFSGHEELTQLNSSVGLGRAADTVLRPFFPYGVLILWASSIRRNPERRIIFRSLAYGTVMLLGCATFDYNRGAVLVAAVALVGSYSRHVRRIRPVVLVMGASALFAGASLFGTYRTIYTGTKGGLVSLNAANLANYHTDINREIQVYTNGMVPIGFIVNETDYGSKLLLGRSLIGSVLYPLPRVGSSIRASSGGVIYNEQVYGRAGINDQIIPFIGEMYWNLGLLGIAMAGLTLGVAIRGIQRAYERSTDFIHTFIVTYIGVWVAFLIVGSISVLVQIFVYFLWPAAVLLIQRRIGDERH